MALSSFTARKAMEVSHGQGLVRSGWLLDGDRSLLHDGRARLGLPIYRVDR